jgi:TolB-like protein/cytochrome c-type biogenesis protein CcmH/NrfG
MADFHAPRGTVRFAAFELDFRASELRKQGTKVKLQEQPFQILQVLLQRPGEIVTREELQQKIWPSDTFVDFDHGLYNAIKRLREALGDSAETPRFVETLSRRGYRFVGKIECESSQMRSLAVLPLENLSRDPEQEYFAEGLTEALITTLAKIGELRVVSRTSAMQYKGVHKPLREIARELEVDTIVEGTVLRAGDRVRITAQLIDAPKEMHLWAESYERDLRDVLALQSEVAQAIARQVQVKLTPQDLAHFAQPHPVDPEAYEAYLKGRYHWNRRPGVRKGIEYFEQAIAKDPTYAAAYAGLADCLSALSAWGVVPANEGCVKAKVLAEKALKLDPSSGEAHSSLALAAMYDFDFLTAQREFERSLELSPRYATGHHLFGFYLGAMGRYEEAYTELQRAIRLDPLLGLTNAFLGYIYLYARRYDQAIEQFVKTLKLDSNSAFAHGGLGWAHRCKSLHEPAIAAFRKAVELWHGPSPLSWLGEAYAAAGCRDEALKVLDQLFELSKQRYVTPYGVARIHATLGNKEEALDWLDAAYRQRAEWMVLLKVDPCLDDLRPDPRFQDLMRRMNFPT